jgi:hypothetical protein
MDIPLYQAVIVIFAILMLGQGFYNFLKKENGQTLLKLLVRIVVWGGMSLVVLFPKFTNFLAAVIGIEGNINAVILTGFLLVFLMIFKLLSAIEKLEQQVTLLTREEGLKELDGYPDK